MSASRVGRSQLRRGDRSGGTGAEYLRLRGAGKVYTVPNLGSFVKADTEAE
ncbi:hypothetical protein EDD27_0199 [Nonomuraea polychroma]|uniref:Uncharacterized protein n=1 Tax=Nonomuraea polychroma TaxID=46176 RepID=A0A438LWR7_9ACTN|nr:hypothetical protein EDD27_0199 [Nonomuraea polychroma]